MLLEQFLDHIIEDTGLLASGVSDGGGIEHRDHGDDEGDNGYGVLKASEESDGYGHTGGEGGVCTGHAAGADEVVEVQFAGLEESTEHFGRLGNGPGPEGGPEARVVEEFDNMCIHADGILSCCGF